MSVYGAIWHHWTDTKRQLERGQGMKGLAEIRKRKGMTQTQLADLAGITRVSVARYETTDREPNLTTARRIARALGVSLSELTEG